MVCKAVSAKHTEDKMRMLSQAFSCWPKCKGRLRQDSLNLHDTNKKNQEEKMALKTILFFFCPRRGIMQTKWVFFTASRTGSSQIAKVWAWEQTNNSSILPQPISPNLESCFLCSHTETQASSLIKEWVQSKKLLVSFDNADLNKGKDRDWIKPSRAWHSNPIVFPWAHSENEAWKTVRRGKKLYYQLMSIF